MLPLCLLLCGCSTVYYAGLEKVGIPKRDLLERRVEKARDAQVETKEQFSSALERFRATVRIDGGELEERYDTLRGELDRCQSRSDTLQGRIEDVEDVAEALFDEWEAELDEYRRADLRAASARRLEDTRRRYKPMIAAMKRAHQRVEPVLSALGDIVLALKHQLNAKAIGALQGELTSVEREVDALVAAMNSSIEQASKFLNNLDAEAPSAGARPLHWRL
jgi:chromosome segregation ATPase